MTIGSTWPVPMEGGCCCGALRYQVKRAPLPIHCCNCQHCQVETGSAFGLNVLIESTEVELLPSRRKGDCNSETSITKPVLILVPSESGIGQLIARCPRCYVAVWSFYAGCGPHMMFLRGGTLDKITALGQSIEQLLRPDLYIYLQEKMPWVVVPDSAAVEGVTCDEFYDLNTKWPEAALARWKAIEPAAQGWKDRGRKWEEAGEFVDVR